jgi:anaerobic selenocysteine-containing dehydrogenase/Pyruvate/2-oxoacid:ferredoxin oxidoreductase delta subunit
VNKHGRQIIHYPEKCVGCFTCEVACKQEHTLPIGIQWIKVLRHGPYLKDNRLLMDYSIRQCKHCDEPKCLAACPEKAIYKRPDGLVLIHEELCSGCQLCQEACPFDAMTFDKKKQVVGKCTMCVHSLDQDIEPTCIKHCPTHALNIINELGCGSMKTSPKPDRIVRTICGSCHCECGVLVHVKDKRVIKVEGDPDHPQNRGMMCPKGLAATQLLYHPDRLKYPLLRKGERGEGHWKRISWDDAMVILSNHYLKIRERYGPEAFFWGWGDGPRGGETILNRDLLESYGSPNIFHSDAHYCYQPVLLANVLTFGTMITSEVGPDYQNSRCIFLWGGNPVHSHPTRLKDIMEGKAKGAKIIVIDPRFTDIAAKADIFLQIRPGTDDALGLGLLNIIINENLFDTDFVRDWCIGFESLRERVQEYPPNRVANICCLSVNDIVETARTYALYKPASMHTRMGLQMSTNTIQTLRIASILTAITGNIDIPGGNLIRNHPKGLRSIADIRTAHRILPQETENLRPGAKEYPLYYGPKAPTFRDSHPPSVIKQILSGKPYPIKGMSMINDLLMCLENSYETLKALQSLEFFCQTDFFLTPTAQFAADLVLPAAMWLERNEICDAFYINFVSARQKVVDPVGECRDEKEIVCELSKRIGIPFNIPINNPEEYNNYRIKDMGISFEDLKSRTYVMTPMRYRKYEATGFNTPSGKVELYSARMAEYGYDPLPYYVENPESPVSSHELVSHYPLNLITGGRHIAFYHSSNRQIPWLRELNPDPLLEIHPETAVKFGIKEGQWVYIETPKMKGRVRLKAHLTLAVTPDVVHAASHWWYPEKKFAEGDIFESSINAILDNGPPYDPISGATPLRGRLCRVYSVY